MSNLISTIEALAGRIASVQERIVAAARRAGRNPDEVTLVAVSKTHSPEEVAAAYAAGLRTFGENRVEEAAPKAEVVARLLAPAPPPAWHMIGHLQSRKAEDVLPWANLVHSVDSVKLAARLSRFMIAGQASHSERSEESPTQAGQNSSSQSARLPVTCHCEGSQRLQRPQPRSNPGLADETASGYTAPASTAGGCKCHPRNDGQQYAEPAARHGELRTTGARLPVLLEVNVSGEASKYGFRTEDLPGAVEAIAALPGLALQGLMTMAPIAADPGDVRPVFAALRMLRDELARRYPALDWRHLSMGMTDDFEVAIEEGATLVRVGRAIFGERTR